MNKQLTVIGGGAAGMMAAICAARRGTAVTLETGGDTDETLQGV